MADDVSSEGNAVYFDGYSSRKRHVALRFAGDLEIVEDNTVVATWPYSAVRRVHSLPNTLRLRCAAGPTLARLEIVDPSTQNTVRERCASLELDGVGKTHTLRILFWSLAAVASIVLAAIFLIPVIAERMAPLVPYAFERRIGEAIDEQVRAALGGKVCTGRDGRAALALLVGKLKEAGGIEHELDAEVLLSPVPNALALPGGKIYMLNGLLQTAGDPDEIAGVLAHELGHIKHRDSMRMLIQNGGTSFLFGLLFGDVTGAGAAIFMARSMLQASYSRDAERSADAFAADVMRTLGRSPIPMGQLLVRVSKAMRSNFGPTLLDSHPLSEDRLATMQKGDRPINGAPLLSASQWRALKDVCR